MTAAKRHRTIAVLTGLALAVSPLAATFAAGPAQATAAPTRSMDAMTVAAPSVPIVTGIRVGRHRTFDRIVVDFSGQAPEAAVRYVKRLRYDGSGEVVDLRGRRSLKIVMQVAYAHHENGTPSLTTPSRATFAYPQIREYALIGDYEGYVTVGVGLRHRAPFRVLTLSDPTRIVVDINH